MKEQLVYLMYNARNGYIKIGKSNNPQFREKTLQSEEPEIDLMASCRGDIEKALHAHFAHYRLRGEWFNLPKAQIAELFQTWNFQLIGQGELIACRIFGHHGLPQTREIKLIRLADLESPTREFAATDEMFDGVSLG